jgi:hypothetical protein
VSYYGTGDYYATGGFFDFIGSAVKKVAQVGLGFATGGVGGAVRAAIPMKAPTMGVPTSFPGEMMPSLPVSVPQPGMLAAVQRALPGGATGMMGAMPPQGYHLNKTAYFLRDGSFVPARSRYVRNRTRNNANGRALRKAIGRVSGFAGDVKRSRKSLKAISSL